VPTGEAQKGADLSDGIKGQIPLQLDAMYRFTPNVSAGAYFSYGFAQLNGDFGDICDASGVDCAARSYRLGVQGAYNFKPGAQFDPWVGLGAGYEWASLDVEAGTEEASMTFSGIEFATLQAGADYRVAPRFTVGPYLSMSLGRYSDLSTDGGFEGDIEEEAFHQWLQFGFRGTFDL
jgi:outer membrane protein W